MKYIKAVTAAFFFFLLNQAGAFAQITVIIQQPPPYQFKVEHMWKVTLVNPTQTTYTVSLHGRATETTEGLIVDATSSAFALPPGTKIINPRELVPINIREANPKYRDVVQNIGGVPTGDYEICVSVINAADGQELGFDCVQASVENLTRVELLEPADGAMFSSTNEEVWNQPALIVPVAINKGIKFIFRQDPGDSTIAYMMGDPVPGIDVELEQRPGGIKIPVKGWDEYMREVGIKEEGAKFLTIRIVTDTGEPIGYMMADPVPGIDVELLQRPGGRRIPLRGSDQQRRLGGNQTEPAQTKEECKSEGGVWVVNAEGRGFCYKTLGRMAYPSPIISGTTAERINAEFTQLSRYSDQGVVEQKVGDILKEYQIGEVRNIKVKQDAGWGILVDLPQGVIIYCAGGDPLKGLNIKTGSGGGGGPCFSAAEVGEENYVPKESEGPHVGDFNGALRLIIIKNPDGSSTAYMMGDPVPGIDIELEQRPGGIKIPVKGWNEYIREVGIKEEGVKFAEVRVVTDTGGSTIAYLMGDPVPGVDISLEQIPGGIKIPLKGPDEYMREVGIKEEGVKRVGSAIGSIPIVGGALARSADVIITQGLNRTAVGSYLIFNWLPPTPIPPGARVTYRLRIAEIYGRQSPYDAIRSNPAFFENRNITSTIYQYPTGARSFEAGMRYAWKVDVYINNVLISESETWEFGMAAQAHVKKRPGPVKYEDIGDNEGSSSHPNKLQTSHQQQERVNNRPILLASLVPGPELLLLQDRTPGQESSGRSPLQFSGNARFNTTLSSRVASFSEQPKNQWTAELNPVLTFYGLPFNASFLLSSQQESNRQSINNFGLNFDLYRLQQDLTSRLEGKIEELESSATAGVPGADPEELNRLKDPENLKDNLDRFGMISGAEKFFMSIRSLGVGTNYPSYSEYTLSGVPVTGVNIEINPGIFYAAFTASANQQGIDNLSYSRSLYAGRIGLGKKEGTHLYFTGLYAKDDEGSIKLDPANNTLTPKANYVFGTEAKLNLFGDKLSLQGEGALAVLTRDTRDPELEHKSIPSWVKNLVHPRISTSFDYSYSGKLAFNNDASATRISLGIKMIGPGYTSLGVPNLRTDQFGYEGKIDQRLFENKFSIGTFFKQYKDNLIQWKTSTTKTTAFGINAGLNLPRLPFLRVTYSPYFQKNDDPNPARQIDNSTTMYSAMTGYSYPIAGLNSSSSFAFSHQQSKTNTGIADYRTDSYMLTEAVSFTFPVTVSASFGLIQSKSALGYGRINNFDVGVSGSLMENWSGTVGMNVAVEKNRNKRTSLYVSSNISPFQGIGIDVRAERNVYSEQQATLGDYREFIFSATLTAQW